MNIICDFISIHFTYIEDFTTFFDDDEDAQEILEFIFHKIEYDCNNNRCIGFKLLFMIMEYIPYEELLENISDHFLEITIECIRQGMTEFPLRVLDKLISEAQQHDILEYYFNTINGCDIIEAIEDFDEIYENEVSKEELDKITKNILSYFE